MSFSNKKNFVSDLDEQPAGKGGQGQSEGGEHQGSTVTAHGGPATAIHHQPQHLQVSITISVNQLIYKEQPIAK